MNQNAIPQETANAIDWTHEERIILLCSAPSVFVYWMLLKRQEIRRDKPTV